MLKEGFAAVETAGNGVWVWGGEEHHMTSDHFSCLTTRIKGGKVQKVIALNVSSGQGLIFQEAMPCSLRLNSLWHNIIITKGGLCF